MKRLHPTALVLINSNECRLRCWPKFTQIAGEERDELLRTVMKEKPVNGPKGESELETDFSFTFDEHGAALQDSYFFGLTTDDYGELWINRSVECLSWANDVGVHLADSPNKLRPHSILVDDSNTDSLRRYKVIFSESEEPTTKEYTFTVEGTGPLRTITWPHGSYTATWASKNWTISKPFPADLEPLLMCIIRLDEAIHLELMPYAMIAD